MKLRTLYVALAISSGAAAVQAQAIAPPPGALSCSGCHPASGKAETLVTPLNGLAAAQIIAAMQDFRNGSRPGTIMDRIAKGFGDDEIRAIAGWFAAQKR